MSSQCHNSNRTRQNKAGREAGREANNGGGKKNAYPDTPPTGSEPSKSDTAPLHIGVPNFMKGVKFKRNSKYCPTVEDLVNIVKMGKKEGWLI